MRLPGHRLMFKEHLEPPSITSAASRRTPSRLLMLSRPSKSAEMQVTYFLNEIQYPHT
jgi:hypothetical protein